MPSWVLGLFDVMTNAIRSFAPSGRCGILSP